MSSILTICIPIMAPDNAALVWLDNVVASIKELTGDVSLLVSAHSVESTNIFGGAEGCVVIESKDHLTYDQNVQKLLRRVQTEYWVLLAVNDVLDLGSLRFIVQKLREVGARRIDLFVLSGTPISSDFSAARLGFISTYVFRTKSSLRSMSHLRSSHGWLHFALFLLALRERQSIEQLACELASEDIPRGYIKPWTSRGNYLNYQISYCRLTNWLIPKHPLRASIEAQATGRWPFDIIKAYILRVSLSAASTRFIRYWISREVRSRGMASLCVRMFRQSMTVVVTKAGVE